MNKYSQRMQIGLIVSILSSIVIADNPPNIILMMADDLGWGDVGFTGNTKILTPHLDNMAATAMRMDRFYSQAPVCSPTRGSVMTSRHPFRYGIFEANVGLLRTEEVTLPEMLQANGYATAHYGKWHMGALSQEWENQKMDKATYSPPQLHGFDEHFVVAHSVPTWNPMGPTGAEGLQIVNDWHEKGYATPFIENGQITSQLLTGDSSRIYVDQAIPFIRQSIQQNKPFFITLWFNTPHKPVIAGPAYLAMYPDENESKQHYYGAITAMDEQIGRVRTELQELGIADNTIVWFTSDNGPTGSGSSGPLRGNKRHLFEGGIRVPTVLEWPAKIPEPRVETYLCTTSDFLPTLLDAANIDYNSLKQIDGQSLMPMIENTVEERSTPIFFQSHGNKAVVGQKWKLFKPDFSNSQNTALNSNLITQADVNAGNDWMLFDLENDPYETTNIASQHPDIVTELKTDLLVWMDSTQDSWYGLEYSPDFILESWESYRCDGGIKGSACTTPFFKGPTLLLADGVKGVPYSADLSTMAQDPNGDALTFTFVSSTPKGLQLSTSGLLSGTPKKGNKNYVITARVEDTSGEFDETELSLHIAKTVTSVTRIITEASYTIIPGIMPNVTFDTWEWEPQSNNTKIINNPDATFESNNWGSSTAISITSAGYALISKHVPFFCIIWIFQFYLLN